MASIVAVTGASRGIGRATALLFAQNGYRVFALARSEPDLHSLAREHPAITPIRMDITDDASRAAAVATIMRETAGYGVDVLVNNAGYGQIGAVEEVPPEALRRQLEVNVVALIAFTQPFLPGMRGRRHGTIVNLSSAAGLVATPFMGAYNASKFALEALSDALRRELSPFGVRVVLIEPGPIKTDFGRVTEQFATVSPDSPYAPRYRRYQGTHHSVGLFGRSAGAVAHVILRAVSSPHPRPRYPVTLPARLAGLAHVLPARLVDWGMSLAMGLH
ncbi:MAG TPA: SDR family oxidoreductase [Chloroflexota bacterium]|nr:SDR family oxidoreductase [Chloroflexota bacterium]